MLFKKRRRNTRFVCVFDVFTEIGFGGMRENHTGHSPMGCQRTERLVPEGSGVPVF